MIAASKGEFEAAMAAVPRAHTAPGRPSGLRLALGALVICCFIGVAVVGTIAHQRHLAPVPRAAPACTWSQPCAVRHYPPHHVAGRLVGAYVLARAGRYLVRIPLHIWRAMRWGRVRFRITLPPR